ncbi:MAG: prolipoprotein diacylglyceryl transferase [Alphaproteobacteria bacterium]|nr:prolipoprotein diacylglyceryl transferase [Alphaproteobacteria bacterium]
MSVMINPISPVAFSVFGLPVRWYALAYIVGFVGGYYLFKYLMGRTDAQLKLDKHQLDDLLTFVIFGVILGGRLGYVLFYNLPFFISNPLEIFALWHGGMSFHGGLVGLVCAVILFAHKRKINAWKILDMMAVVAPIGLFFGRIANFINMELMGRVTDSPFGVMFAGVDAVPHYPSPLFEAATEGVLLFVLMQVLYYFTGLRHRPGALAGIMGMGYACARVFCELFRAPDVQIGFLTSWGLTMGQLLSGIMFVAGTIIFLLAIYRKK